MSERISFELPDKLLQGDRDIARQSNRSLETVLLEVVDRYLVEPLPEEANDDILESLAQMSDTRLWAIVRRHLHTDRNKKLTSSK